MSERLTLCVCKPLLVLESFESVKLVNGSVKTINWLENPVKVSSRH